MSVGDPGLDSVTRTGHPDVSDRSVGELISEVTTDLTTLMRQELELAKAELKQEATSAGKAAGMLGAAGFAGYMVVLFLSIALWWALANGMDEGWAALIVAVLWAVVAAVLAVSAGPGCAGSTRSPNARCRPSSRYPMP